jgi:hypothetical protein
VIVVIVVVAWWLIVPAADWLANHDAGPAHGIALINARNNARGTLLTLGAGVVAAGALVFTARNFALSRRMLQVTEHGQRRSFELTEQAQVTDRYTKAIEQLGSDKLDIRVGGIYALERIALDSPRDHPTIVEVLSTFVREHSRKQQPIGGSVEQHSRANRPDGKQQLEADIEAAVTVLCRREKKHDTRSINLAGADIPGANLNLASLEGVNLTGANLTGASFNSAWLMNATLTGANLTRASLDSAWLMNADLTGANLTRAELTLAIFTHANLTDANLNGANLTNARLDSAELTNATLTGANLDGVRWRSPPVEWIREEDGT